MRLGWPPEVQGVVPLNIRRVTMASPQTGSRTYGELLETAEKLSKAEFERQEAQRRQKHIAEMQELAKREAQTWQEVETTLASGYTPIKYDYATTLLSKLQQLAEFQGTQSGFNVRLRPLVKKYKGRGALMDRWKQKGWI